VEGLRREGDPITLDPATVICAECGKTIGEDEAQATRWGYWAESVGDLYPSVSGAPPSSSATLEARPTARKHAARRQILGSSALTTKSVTGGTMVESASSTVDPGHGREGYASATRRMMPRKLRG